MNDAYLHMIAGASIGCLTSLFLYRNTHMRIIWCLVIASFTADLITLGKEEIYDRQLGKGVPSKKDKADGWYGSKVGVIISIPIIQRNEQRIEKELFENLNLKTDSLKLKLCK